MQGQPALARQEPSLMTGTVSADAGKSAGRSRQRETGRHLQSVSSTEIGHGILRRLDASKYAFCVPVRHGECSVRERHKELSVLLRVRCPPTAFPAAHSPRTEASARPVSKSSFKQDYTIPRPSKRPHIGRGAAQTIWSKPVTPMSESGQKRRFDVAPLIRSIPINEQFQSRSALRKSAINGSH
jgi:hypothetical protein